MLIVAQEEEFEGGGSKRCGDPPPNALPYGLLYDKDTDVHWGFLFRPGFPPPPRGQNDGSYPTVTDNTVLVMRP